MAVANLGDEVVATARAYRNKLTDNVTNHIALLRKIKEGGNLSEDADGGRSLCETLIYGTNSSGKYYSGYEGFTPPTTQEILDAAEYQWKQYGIFISVSGKDRFTNRGPNKRVDFIKARMKQATAQAMNTLGLGCFADGTGSGGKELGGLKLLVADNPAAAGTVGGIDQVANTFWRNKFSNIGAAVTSTNVEAAFRAMWLATIRGTDKVDLIVGDDEWYTAIWAALDNKARFVDAEKINGGQPGGIRWRSAEIFFDDACPDKRCYFLNTDSIRLRYAPGRWLDVDDKQRIQGTDYEVIPMWFAGNFTCDRRASNGVLIST